MSCTPVHLYCTVQHTWWLSVCNSPIIPGLRDAGQPDRGGERVGGGLQGAEPGLRPGQGQDDGGRRLRHERLHGKIVKKPESVNM